MEVTHCLHMSGACMRAEPLQSCPTLLPPYGLYLSRRIYTTSLSMDAPGKKIRESPCLLPGGFSPTQGLNPVLKSPALQVGSTAKHYLGTQCVRFYSITLLIHREGLQEQGKSLPG